MLAGRVLVLAVLAGAAAAAPDLEQGYRLLRKAAAIAGLNMTLQQVQDRTVAMNESTYQLALKYDLNVVQSLQRVHGLIAALNPEDPLGEAFDALSYETARLRILLHNGGASELDLFNLDEEIALLRLLKPNDLTHDFARRMASMAYDAGISFTEHEAMLWTRRQLLLNYQVSRGHNFNPRRKIDAITMKLAHGNLPGAITQLMEMKAAMIKHKITDLAHLDEEIVLLGKLVPFAPAPRLSSSKKLKRIYL